MSGQPLAALDSTASREMLLDAAAREIHVRGFQAASISRILAETGLTKGALYHHFPSKLELGYSVFDECYLPILHERWIEPLRTGDGDPVQLLVTIIESVACRMQDADVALGCPINNLAQEMSPVDAGFRERIASALADWREAIEQALERGRETGFVIAEADTAGAATFIVAAFEGCIGMAKNAQSHDVLVQCGNGLIDYVRTLRKRP